MDINVTITNNDELELEVLVIHPGMTWSETKNLFYQLYVQMALRASGGNVSEAARIADKDRKDFYDTMRKANIDPNDYR